MSLILHCGSREVTRRELAVIEPPQATRTWRPVKHATYLDVCEAILEGSGFRVEKERFGLSKDNHSFFGALDLATPLAPGVRLSVGIRSNTSRKFPFGFACGSRTTVCDNMLLSSELVVKHRHSVHGMEKMRSLVSGAVQSLSQYREAEARRIDFAQRTYVSGHEPQAFMIEAMRRGIISTKILPQVVDCWFNPPHDWGNGTLWHLVNAFTTPLQPLTVSNPARFQRATMALTRLIFPNGNVGFDDLPENLGYLPPDDDIDLTGLPGYDEAEGTYDAPIDVGLADSD